MFTMPEPPDETQPVPPEDQRVALFKARYIWLFVAAYTAYVAFMLWHDDEVKLYGYHSLVRILQTVARVCGEQGLTLEKKYNDYVNLLH